MARSARRRRAASALAEQSTTPHQPGGQSHCRAPRRLSTEARRALGASRSSLLASSPPWQKAEGADAKRASRDALQPGDFIPEWRAKSSRNAERHQIGMVGDIIPDSRATSPGIRSKIADPLVKLGRALEIGEQKSQASDLEPLLGIDRVGAVKVAKHLVGQKPLGGEEGFATAEQLVQLVVGYPQPRQHPRIGPVLQRQTQRPGAELQGPGRRAQLVENNR